MIHFIGDSYAALTLKAAAKARYLPVTENISSADLIFVSQDTPTDKDGNRDLMPIRALIATVPIDKPLVITSQVPPGFCDRIRIDRVAHTTFHQAETLRTTGDGAFRAMYPEMFIVGMENRFGDFPLAYRDYLSAFDCPVLKMSFRDAEFTKIAINMTLAAQVDNANRLSSAAAKCGADWGRVANAMRHDSRIGKYSYLTPGRWTDSPHLRRDAVTLSEILAK
jgi:UDP-glucose 6-dehydrogenase